MGLSLCGTDSSCSKMPCFSPICPSMVRTRGPVARGRERQEERENEEEMVRKGRKRQRIPGWRETCEPFLTSPGSGVSLFYSLHHSASCPHEIGSV